MEGSGSELDRSLLNKARRAYLPELMEQAFKLDSLNAFQDKDKETGTLKAGEENAAQETLDSISSFLAWMHDPANQEYLVGRQPEHRKKFENMLLDLKQRLLIELYVSNKSELRIHSDRYGWTDGIRRARTWAQEGFHWLMAKALGMHVLDVFVDRTGHQGFVVAIAPTLWKSQLFLMSHPVGHILMGGGFFALAAWADHSSHHLHFWHALRAIFAVSAALLAVEGFTGAQADWTQNFNLTARDFEAGNRIIDGHAGNKEDSESEDEPRLASVPSDTRSLSDSSRQLSFDLRDLTADYAQRLLKLIQQPKTVVIEDPEYRKLGDSAAMTPLVVSAIRRRWPRAHLILISSRPELFAGLEGVETFRSAQDYSPAQLPDLWISDHPSSIATRRPAKMFLFGLRHYWLTEPADAYGPMWLRSRLNRLNLAPGDVRLFPLKRLGHPVRRIFINIHGYSNYLNLSALKSPWITLIQNLVAQGYEIELNDAPQYHKANNELIEAIGSDRVTLRPLNSTQELVEYLRHYVEAVITVDTGVFHVAHLFGIVTLVIRTNLSTGWVPRTKSAFDAIPLRTFMKDPLKAIKQFLSLWPTTPPLKSPALEHSA
jgi:hypothetical protein